MNMIIEKIREYVHSQWTLGTLHGAHRGLAPLRLKQRNAILCHKGTVKFPPVQDAKGFIKAQLYHFLDIHPILLIGDGRKMG